MRKVKSVIWVSPNDCIPPHGLDMQSSRDYNKVDMLTEEFKKNGFDLNMPALVGYPLNGKIQLLSGTHRLLAAANAGIKIPVAMWLRSYVERLWGTESWVTLIEDMPVTKLLELEYEHEKDMSKFEPVILEY